MTAPPTPKPTCKAEALVREPPTIVSRREEDAAQEGKGGRRKEIRKKLECERGIAHGARRLWK
jgi:hypothetical protein